MEDLEAALASEDPGVLRAALKKAQAALRQAREQACRCDELVSLQQADEAASRVCSSAASGGGGGGDGGGSPALMFSLEQLQASRRPCACWQHEALPSSLRLLLAGVSELRPPSPAACCRRCCGGRTSCG